MPTEFFVWCPKCKYQNKESGMTTLLAEAHSTPACDGTLQWVPEIDADEGALITLEGLDGSGKTSLWESLKAEYRECDDVLFTREPTLDSWYGDAVYRSLRDDDADSLAELFLYFADHANHLAETIRPALAEGKIVICDRYLDSRCAYQSATLQDQYGDAVFEDIYQLHKQWSVFPDMTLYLDVSPETGAARSEQANKFETVEYLRSVETYYQRLLNRDDRNVVIDSESNSETEVYQEAQEAIVQACRDPLSDVE